MSTAGIGWAGKSILVWVLLVGLCALCCLGNTSCAYAGYAEVQGGTVEQGYNDDVQYLSAYGEWVDTRPWGMVWRPSVIAAWEPFSYGHWVWSNFGWAWVSYEPFGWLVYHYGYWDYDAALGWFWIPGDTWSPARVQWECFGDYAAWAPLPPPNVYWPNPWDTYPVNVWFVVNINNFQDEDIGRYRVMRSQFQGHVPTATLVRRAPDVRHLEIVTRRPVPLVKIQKQEMDVRRQVTAPRVRYARPTNPKLNRMTLPPDERSKVDRHMPQVEHEVLAPRKAVSPPPAPQQRQEKGRSESGRKKKG